MVDTNKDPGNSADATENTNGSVDNTRRDTQRGGFQRNCWELY